MDGLLKKYRPNFSDGPPNKSALAPSACSMYSFAELMPSECDDVIRRAARQQKARAARYRIDRSLMDFVAPPQSICAHKQILGC